MPCLLVVDGHNFINRANAFSQGMSTSSGFPTGVIAKTIPMIACDARLVDATHVCVVFDHSADNDKVKRYDFYKFNRRHKVDDGSKSDMRMQIRPLINLLKSVGIRVVRKKGTEGDEVVAAVAKRFVERYGDKAKVIIATNDKDMAQLVDKQVSILKPDKRVLGLSGIREEYGVPPDKIIEYLMLVGDSVDGIPGVDKCGPKTAVKWLEEYGTIKNLLHHTDDLTPAMRKKVKEAAKLFKATRWLIKLRTDLEISNSFEPVADLDTLKDLCNKYELNATVRPLLELGKRIGACL